MKALARLALLSAGMMLLFSCTNPLREERKAILPADSIIPEPVMVQLLADVHILEAGLLVKRNHGEKTIAMAQVWYRDLFAKYHISEERFKENLRYYQWDTEEYSALYDKVLAEIRSRNAWVPATTEPPAKGGKKKPKQED